MTLPLSPPFPPMEALLVEEIPAGECSQYEPKWDGFRCLTFRDGDGIELQSKSGQPVARHFPDIVERLRAVSARRFVLDGEIVVPVDGYLSFDHLLLRMHPAESRVKKLAAERPAWLGVFDLLVDERGRSLVEHPLRERRRRLEAFAAEYLGDAHDIPLSSVTRDRAKAREWLSEAGATLDGVIAKRLDVAYRSGERTGMQKVRFRHGAHLLRFRPDKAPRACTMDQVAVSAAATTFGRARFNRTRAR